MEGASAVLFGACAKGVRRALEGHSMALLEGLGFPRLAGPLLEVLLWFELFSNSNLSPK